MAKNEKPQPGPDGIIRLPAGYPRDAVTLNGNPIRAGEPGFVRTTRGNFVQRPIIVPIREGLSSDQE